MELTRNVRVVLLCMLFCFCVFAHSGQLDGARPGNGVPVTGESLRAALALLVEGKEIPESMMVPSIGCNIKWREGNEPDYFG